MEASCLVFHGDSGVYAEGTSTKRSIEKDSMEASTASMYGCFLHRSSSGSLHLLPRKKPIYDNVEARKITQSYGYVWTELLHTKITPGEERRSGRKAAKNKKEKKHTSQVRASIE